LLGPLCSLQLVLCLRLTPSRLERALSRLALRVPELILCLGRTSLLGTSLLRSSLIGASHIGAGLIIRPLLSFCYCAVVVAPLALLCLSWRWRLTVFVLPAMAIVLTPLRLRRRRNEQQRCCRRNYVCSLHSPPKECHILHTRDRVARAAWAASGSKTAG
jgi:hypothetical protein